MDSIKYPIGIQSFETLRKNGCVYADKTGFIYRLANSGSNTFFLSRPRRFGKSLLLSTFYAYFSGRKELFEGLDIYNLETEWKSYPVLRFDFSRAEANSSVGLENFIINRLEEFEQEFDIVETAQIKERGDRFGSLIERIYKKYGKQIVILIDEYDKGIHEVIENQKQLTENQEILRPFFSQIKAQGEYLRFCFITGVARFHNYTLFSGFNNPCDISMNPKYAGICGITEKELLNYFSEGIKVLSSSLNISFDSTIEQLRLKYDGYRFTDSADLVYNPFSLLNCFENCKMSNYWIKSGTPKVFVDFLSKSKYKLLELENIWTTQEAMEDTYSIQNPVPLLFQTGYLTIKEYDQGYYRLGVPNGEVRSALVDDLIPKYLGIGSNEIPPLIVNLKRKLNLGDAEGFMSILQSLVSQIPYHEIDVQNLEKTYHLVIYELFLILGIDARSEIAIAGGRIDMVVQTLDFVYVFEFKLGGSAKQALEQIEDKGYALPWKSDGRKIIKIGAVFSPETRTLSHWEIV